MERGTYLYGFSAMWDNEKTPKTYFLPDYPVFKKDIHSDRSVCSDLFKILDQPEPFVAVAHNGNSFDLKIINSRLMINGYPPPQSPRGSLDTLRQTRRIFRMDSNRLDACGQVTGVGRKLDTPKGLHQSCYHGDPRAFRTMAKYCRQDVVLLRDYFKKIEPWLDIKFSGKLTRRHISGGAIK